MFQRFFSCTTTTTTTTISLSIFKTPTYASFLDGDSRSSVQCITRNISHLRDQVQCLTPKVALFWNVFNYLNRNWVTLKKTWIYSPHRCKKIKKFHNRTLSRYVKVNYKSKWADNCALYAPLQLTRHQCIFTFTCILILGLFRSTAKFPSWILRTARPRGAHSYTEVYTDVWLTVHRNSVWIRKTN